MNKYTFFHIWGGGGGSWGALTYIALCINGNLNNEREGKTQNCKKTVNCYEHFLHPD